MNEKKIIIYIIDIDEATALECVRQCVSSENKNCVWSFTKSTNEKIIVFDTQNKKSVKYTVYKDGIIISPPLRAYLSCNVAKVI